MYLRQTKAHVLYSIYKLHQKIKTLKTGVKSVLISQLFFRKIRLYQYLVVNIQDGSIHTMKENTEALVTARKEIGLEVYADKTNYVFMSRDKNAGRSHSIKTDNSSFARVVEFKYLGTDLTNQNFVQEEIKSRLKSGNACYHSVQNLLSSSLPSKNMKIKIHRNIIFRVALCGCKTWSLTLREKRRLTVFENRVLRRIFGQVTR